MSYKAKVEAYKMDADGKRVEAEIRAGTLEYLLIKVSKKVDNKFLILKRVVVSGGASSSTGHSNKLKVRESKAFNRE